MLHNISTCKDCNYDISNLCTPAFIYFILSILSIISMFIFNRYSKQYCVGNIKCNIPNSISIYIAKIVYTFFWTWVLNEICKRGYTNISWFLLILPYVLMFFLIIMLMFTVGSAKTK